MSTKQFAELLFLAARQMPQLAMPTFIGVWVGTIPVFAGCSRRFGLPFCVKGYFVAARQQYFIRHDETPNLERTVLTILQRLADWVFSTFYNYRFVRT